MVAAVARLEPQTALNPPHEAIVAIASPPRMPPNQAFEAA